MITRSKHLTILTTALMLGAGLADHVKTLGKDKAATAAYKQRNGG
jgi:hypothetical protein